MKRTLVIVGILSLLLLSGYYLSTIQKSPQLQNSNHPAPTSSQQPEKEPITYSGTLPCADCSGIETSLTLKPDNSYQMSEVYQGKNDKEPFITTGTWKKESGISSNSKSIVYTLRSDSGTMTYYEVKNDDEILLLDSEKKPIDTSSNNTLKQKE